MDNDPINLNDVLGDKADQGGPARDEIDLDFEEESSEEGSKPKGVDRVNYNFKDDLKKVHDKSIKTNTEGVPAANQSIALSRQNVANSDKDAIPPFIYKSVELVQHIFNKIIRGEKYFKPKHKGGGTFINRRSFEISTWTNGGLIPVAPGGSSGAGSTVTTVGTATAVSGGANLQDWLDSEMAKPTFQQATIQLRTVTTSDSDAGVNITTDYTITISSSATGGILFNVSVNDDSNGSSDQVVSPAGTTGTNDIFGGGAVPFTVNSTDNVNVVITRTDGAGLGNVDACTKFTVSFTVYVQHTQ